MTGMPVTHKHCATNHCLSNPTNLPGLEYNILSDRGEDNLDITAAANEFRAPVRQLRARLAGQQSNRSDLVPINGLVQMKSLQSVYIYASTAWRLLVPLQ